MSHDNSCADNYTGMQLLEPWRSTHVTYKATCYKYPGYSVYLEHTICYQPSCSMSFSSTDVHTILQQRQHTQPLPRRMHTWHPTCGKMHLWRRLPIKNLRTTWPRTIVLLGANENHKCFLIRCIGHLHSLIIMKPRWKCWYRISCNSTYLLFSHS